jgi:hypothetical protein
MLAHKDYQLNHEGVTTNATVTSLTSRQYGNGTEYSVYYAYNDTSGLYHVANSVVRFSEWKNLRVNGSIPILYVRANPSENRVNLPYETKLYHDNGTITPLFSGFLALVGVALILAAYIDTRYPSVPHFSPMRHLWPASRPKTYKFHKTY